MMTRETDTAAAAATSSSETQHAAAAAAMASSRRDLDDQAAAATAAATGSSGGAITSSSDSAEDDTSDKASGGGYSADCSASDQLSDDTTATPSPAKKMLLAVNRLDLADRQSSGDDDDEDQDDCSDYQSQSKQSLQSQDTDEMLQKRLLQGCIGGRSRSSPLDHRSHRRASEHQRRDERERHDRNSGFNMNMESLLRSHKMPGNEHWQMPAGPLPQWNGVRIADAMDPRFDALLAQQQQQQYPLYNPLQQTADMAQQAARFSRHNDNAYRPTQQQSFDHYLRLLEMCHPFYREHLGQQMDLLPTNNAEAGEGSEPPSSEGFTSFFTTTHSSNNGSSSDGDKNSADNNNKDPTSRNEDANSASRHHQGSSGGSTAGEQRGRRQEQQAQIAAAADNQQQPANDSSMSSSSSSEAALHDHHRFGSNGPHAVTESSASGANTNSGVSSGNNASSASNLGSSGSGNDKNSSEEGKGTGSSEDAAARDGDHGMNDGSDEAEQPVSKEATSGRHSHHEATDANKDHVLKHGSEYMAGDATRERKLLDKKRKRKEMRREYEAQQQSESSDNTETDKVDDMLCPGRYCTLENVLQFSKIARILVQSNPPFLVVHTNAAYSRLTSVDSHRVVGKPIKELLSIDIPNNGRGRLANHVSGDVQHEGAVQSQVASPVQDTVRNSEQKQEIICLERLIASSGFGKLHNILVHAASHHLIGANLMIYRDGSAALEDGGKKQSTVDAANEERGHFIRCTSSIAPIVSIASPGESMVGVQRESPPEALKPKKRRHLFDDDIQLERQQVHNTDSYHRRNHQQSMPRITHFVIQLSASDSKQRETDLSFSSGSTSVQARLLGLSKNELTAQRLVTHRQAAPMGSEEGEGENHSESTEHTEVAMTAVG